MATALALMYLSHLLYYQMIMLVCGGAAMAVILVHEKRAAKALGAQTSLAGADRLAALEQALSSMEGRMSRPTSDDDARYLRAKMASVENEVRRLRWSMREEEAERMRRGFAREGLRALPRPLGWRKLRGQDKRELSHLLDSLDEAEEVLATEPPQSARPRLRLIAADVKAHHRLLRRLDYRSRNLGDYGVAWAVLESIASGANLGHDMRTHASKKVKSKLDGLYELAAARDLTVLDPVSPKSDEDVERWK